MKYAVIGAGAIGGGIAARLFMAGEDVWLIDTAADHIGKIMSDGLTIELDYGVRQETKNLKIKAAADAAGIGKVDVVIVAVKGTVTRMTIPTIRELAGTDTLILSDQNGLGNDGILQEFFPKEQIGYSVVSYGGHRSGTGAVFSQVSVGNLHLAVTAYDEKQREKLVEMSRSLEKVDFKMICCSKAELDKLLWAKLTTNCVLNGTCAVCQCTADGFFSCQAGIDLTKKIVEENCSVARGLGIDLKPEDVPMISYTVQQKAEEGYRHFPSMVPDVGERRKTEVDFINGAVVREGQKLGIPTPYNEAISLLIKVIESNYDYRYGDVTNI